MLLYRCLITLLTPVLLVALLIRVLRRIENFTDLCERLGLWQDMPDGAFIWFHGASNGELTAARLMLETLAQNHPEHRFLISCNTTTAKNMVRHWENPQIHARLAPIDLRWIYKRLVTRLKPQLFVLIEADFWPNRLIVFEEETVPIALVGARISQKSARAWGKRPNISRNMFGSFEKIFAQDEISKSRLLELGAKAENFGPDILLKSFINGPSAEKATALRNEIWLAASTHTGEDETLLHAHQIVLATSPSTKLIIAPRHPKRGESIAKLAHSCGLTVTRRSEGHELEEASQVYIADTLGEMDQWYSAANSCFVGGSLVAKGGHTPFEPLAFGCVILHGPHLSNFEEPYAKLDAHKAAYLLNSAHDIAEKVLALKDQGFADQTRQNARAALVQTDGLDVVLATLSQMIKN